MPVLSVDESGLWARSRGGTLVDRGPGRSPVVSSADAITFFPRGQGWAARWYAGRAASGRASLYSCYVDITTPAVFGTDTVRLLDLDLDVVRTWDGEVSVVDEEEFAHDRETLGYPPEIAEAASRSATRIRRALEAGTHPFDMTYADLSAGQGVQGGPSGGSPA
ncbi:MAG TPA: DUF402 domain-containing protein [Actinopolymorphaceae bacterium]